MTMNASPSSRSRIDLGRAVRAARERRHERIVDVAARGGCAPGTWAKVERGGTVHLDMYEKIAKGLGVPTELVADAARSIEHLPALLAVLGGAAGPAFPAASTLDDVQLFDALDAIVAEVYRRYLQQGDNLAAMSALTRRTVPRRPRVRPRAVDEAAALDANRTEQERHHGMG